MGHIKTPTAEIELPDVEGIGTLDDLYRDIQCQEYTDKYRVRMIDACGKLGRCAWGVLPVLHDLRKSKNHTLSEAAEAAIKKIDPGASLVGPPAKTGMGTTTHSSSYPTSGLYNGRQHQGHQTTVAKPQVNKIVIEDIPGDLDENARLLAVCNFCEKMTSVSPKLRTYNHQIAGPAADGEPRLFCNFCLRNEFYRKKYGKNVLLMSFRGIIGYYYYCFHIGPKHPTMYINDIQGYIDLHARLGSQNPLFRYDPESFTWFVDFSKVGEKRRQMPVDFVLETVVQILYAFNPYENVREASPAALFQRFKEAIVEFHHHRRRPPGQRLLAPTLFGCGIPTDTNLNRAIPVSALKGFMPSHMMDSLKLKSGRYCG